jgi:hypothetical protein
MTHTHPLCVWVCVWVSVGLSVSLSLSLSLSRSSGVTHRAAHLVDGGHGAPHARSSAAVGHTILQLLACKMWAKRVKVGDSENRKTF